MADVYAVISYYLQNQTEVDAYLAQIDKQSEALKSKIEDHIDTTNLRKRLLKRRKPLHDK